jgi:hypothetical protein
MRRSFAMATAVESSLKTQLVAALHIDHIPATRSGRVGGPNMMKTRSGGWWTDRGVGGNALLWLAGKSGLRKGLHVLEVEEDLAEDVITGCLHGRPPSGIENYTKSP